MGRIPDAPLHDGEATAGGYPLSVVSVDIGGTKIAAAVVSYERRGAAPRVAWRTEVATHAEEGGEAVLSRVVGACREALSHAEGRVAGIGVGTAGRVDVRTGSIAHANELMPGWTGCAVRARLAEEFSLPVAVLGDVQAHALGEARWGAARGAQTCIVMAPGTGLGGGIICHGRIVRGAHGFAGEIGSTLNPLAVDDGNLESVASGSGIEARYRQATGDAVGGAEVSRRANEGEAAARRVIEDAGRALGLALAGWANMLDPEVAVVSGSVTKAGAAWRDALEKTYRSRVPAVLAELPIVDAALGSDAPLIGAAENLLDSVVLRTPE